MTTLCMECFPDGGCFEVHSIVPLSPCAACGRRDDRHNRGLRCNLFPRDPRQSAMEAALRGLAEAVVDEQVERLSAPSILGRLRRKGME